MFNEIIEIIKNQNILILIFKPGIFLNMFNLKEYTKEFQKLSKNKYDFIIINMEELFELDSTGLGFLIELRELLNKQYPEQPIIIELNNEHIERIFNNTCLINSKKNFFKIVKNQNEAFEYIRCISKASID